MRNLDLNLKDIFHKASETKDIFHYDELRPVLRCSDLKRVGHFL